MRRRRPPAYRRSHVKARRIVVLGLSLAAGIALAVVFSTATDLGPFGSSKERMTLKVMTFNVFYGGDDYDLQTGEFCAKTNGCSATLDKVVAAIADSGADVVGLEEGEGNTEVIAKRLGWNASPRTQTISRYPLIDPPGANGAYVLVEVEPGKVAAVASVHLPSDPYGPYAVRDGASAAEVIALEQQTRLPMLQERLEALRPIVDDGMPVFLVGDFNSPSQLDWTQAAADDRDEVPYELAWPVGTLAADEGFRDSYREAHPDPVETPGFTWTPGGPETDPKEVHDRIDWVLAAGPADTEASEILGETGNPDVTLAVDPFPSDHRGVVSTFSVEPADMPVLVAVAQRRLAVGDDVHVTFHAPDGNGRLTVVPAGATPNGIDDADPTGASDGEVTLTTAGLEEGAYEAALVGGDGEILSRSPFWLYPPGAKTQVAATEGSFPVGEPIERHVGERTGQSLGLARPLQGHRQAGAHGREHPRRLRRLPAVRVHAHRGRGSRLVLQVLANRVGEVAAAPRPLRGARDARRRLPHRGPLAAVRRPVALATRARAPRPARTPRASSRGTCCRAGSARTGARRARGSRRRRRARHVAARRAPLHRGSDGQLAAPLGRGHAASSPSSAAASRPRRAATPGNPSGAATAL